MPIGRRSWSSRKSTVNGIASTTGVAALSVPNVPTWPASPYGRITGLLVKFLSLSESTQTLLVAVS